MAIYNKVMTAVLLIAGLLSPFAGAGAQDKSSVLKLNTIVIDPGHGGKDPGCVSRDRKVYEKNLTLSISRLFGQKIKEAYPDVKVYYTRTTDRYLTLNERADIANRNNANLFVSVHINSIDNTTAPNGYSAHILGQSSKKNTDLFSNHLDVCRRENSVILLEDDYSTKYQGFDPTDPESFIFFNLMQSAFYEQSLQFAAEFDKAMSGGPIRTSRGVSQDPFYVLWKTTMPAVLLELGFMSNTNDLKALDSAAGREQIATRMFNAFREFKRKYDGSLEYGIAPETASRETSPQEEAAASGNDGSVDCNAVMYGVQVLVSGRRLDGNDKAFKGHEASSYRSGNLYKYIIGECESLGQAKAFHQNVRKSFPDSFVVKIQDGKVSRP